MPRRCLLTVALYVCLFLGTEPCVHAAQSEKVDSKFTIEEVVKLSKAGFPDDLIITKIKKTGKAFDLNADELVELKKAGVSAIVVRFLLDPSQPYVPVPLAPLPVPVAPVGTPTQPAVAAKKYPPDAHASKIPAEPGLYHIVEDSPAKIGIKVLLGTKQSTGLGKVVLKKGKVVAYLVGSAAKTRLKGSAPVFYMRLPEGKGIEEIILLVLKSEEGRREISLGSAPPKQEIDAENTREFQSVEVGPRMFRIWTGELASGEYVFFLLGSAEPPKGTEGKGYDFGIDSQPPKASIDRVEVFRSWTENVKNVEAPTIRRRPCPEQS